MVTIIEIWLTPSRTTISAEARAAYDKSVATLKELSAKSPSNTTVRYNLGLSYLKRSSFLSDSGDATNAIENANEAAKIGDALLRIDANNAAARTLLALSDEELGKCNALLATKATTSSNERTDDWRKARDWYQKGLDLFLDMKGKDTLNGANARKPDELAKEIAKCDAALAQR